jgi:hypothetical protein
MGLEAWCQASTRENKLMSTSRIARFIIWICSKFNKAEIELIVVGLSDVLSDRNPEVKPKDDFKEKHPNYRNFTVDPLPPLTEPPAGKKKRAMRKITGKS